MRFVDESGHQEWLGWNPGAGTWEAWDDPRADYPGDPTDVLDSAGFSDPAPAVVEEITTGRTEAVEMDERLDRPMDTWVDDPADHQAALPDTDDTVALADLDF